MAWLRGLPLAAQVGMAVATLVALIWAGVFIQDLLIGSAKVEARLGTEQADAAIQSGQDAVDTLGENQARSDATDDKVKGIQDDVENADDAAGADAAGRDGLCQSFGLCE